MTKNKGGRPRKKIDYDLVEKLASIFCTQKEIAIILDVSLSTLEHDKEFLRIHKKGREDAKSSLRRKQFKLAESNATMAIFLGKNYLEQKDRQEHEHTGPDGGPVNIKITLYKEEDK